MQECDPMNYEAGQVVQVTAVDVAHGGWCVARPEDGPVVFVRHALPGETVLARLTEVTSRLARAEAVEVLTPSPDRVEPPCPHAGPGRCGGCDWQHAALPAQRSLKAAVVRQQLRRLAGIDREVTVEALPGDEQPGAGLGWRTRVQFAVRPDGVAGLRAHRSHEVVDIGECLIAHPAITDLGLPARRWPATDSVEALVATGSGERALIITPSAKPTAARGRAGRPAPAGALAAGRSVSIEGITADSVLRRASPSNPSNRRLTPMRGRTYLMQRAAGRDWRVTAGAFWQVHPGAADVLTEAVMTGLEPRPGDVALDLYCGAGLFAGALAQAVGPGGTVIGVEADTAAVRDARHNLRQWPWARVHKGDVAAVLARGDDSAPARGGSTPPDPPGRPPREDIRRSGQQGAEGAALPAARLVAADPPRSGLAREVIDYLSEIEHGAARFAYVSCDPATLARDIALLTARGWELADLRAFDAFPMTHHVECVAVLVRSPA
jgi:tRNA/tmRNA/rRNA uracil-C5-methylase (TrmA/RlmC/RlmD family)